MTRPPFIALEGMDGAGTTEQCKRLVERIRYQSSVALTAQPSNGPIGHFIRREQGVWPPGILGVGLRLEVVRRAVAFDDPDLDVEIVRIFEHAIVLLVLRTPELLFALSIDKARQALRWALSPTCERSRVQAYADQARAHEVVASLAAPLLVASRQLAGLDLL